MDMENVFANIGKIILIVIIGFVFSFISGTFFWMIYEHIHALFPLAAGKGIIPKTLGWWDSVCICWLFGFIFKKSVTNFK